MDFYLSPEWRRIRYVALKRGGGRCAACGRGRAEGAVLHVDHIKPRSRFPELALVLSNLQILCADCNVGKGNKDVIDWRPRRPRSERPKCSVCGSNLRLPRTNVPDRVNRRKRCWDAQLCYQHIKQACGRGE